MKILLVEDEPSISSFIEEGLASEGYGVTICESGEEALSLFHVAHFDLVILDWMLPGISGIEVCRDIRKTDKKTPILFLTARDSVEDTIEGLDAGGDDYIKKPFHFEELLARIRSNTRLPEYLSTQLVLGEMVLDLDARQCFCAGIEIHLTQKEFELLAFLMARSGKVCKRNEIIEKVWDIHFDYPSGVIDVYINSLRKKLNLKANEFIHTIRGVGYMVQQ